ncbi:MAG: peptide deformylase [Candidatus Berkelbacteria bacterium]
MKIEIKKENDLILRKPTDLVVDFGFEHQQLVENMIETMRDAKGIGLAAPQVGVSKKIFVCEFEEDPDLEYKGFPLTVVCNPKIIKSSQKTINMVEGCLSFPGREILVRRPKSVEIVGQDRYGNPISIKAKDLFSRVIQHEYDHLQSTLMIDHIKETKIVFIGSGTLGTYALQYLASDPQYKVVKVVTGKLNTTGRSKDKVFNPIAKLAKELKLPILETEDINDEKNVQLLKNTKAKLAVMADFGQFLKSPVLNLFEKGIINIHPSLLPKHRGPSPVVQTILDGDKITGVTLILTVAKLDAGPIISQSKVKLSGAETASILKDFLAKMGAELLLACLPYYLAGELPPYGQSEGKATYSRLFDKKDGEITAETPAIEIERMVRAFDHWPSVFIFQDGIRIRITGCHLDTSGNLIVDRVQREGKKEMAYEEYLRGHNPKLTFGA